MIRAILFFSGRVQGVGFRYNAKEIARKYAVRGTVENCDDGRVKIIVEAESQEIDRFVEHIQGSFGLAQAIGLGVCVVDTSGSVFIHFAGKNGRLALGARLRSSCFCFACLGHISTAFEALCLVQCGVVGAAPAVVCRPCAWRPQNVAQGFISRGCSVSP